MYEWEDESLFEWGWACAVLGHGVLLVSLSSSINDSLNIETDPQPLLNKYETVTVVGL